jgi:membrane protein DedA with SNARE-associated domain
MRFEKDHRTMIWLSIVSLGAGALLAHRFKIIVLVPATLLVVVVAAGTGLAQTKGVWSILLMIAAASVGMQTGYFIGMLIQHALGALLARRSSSFSDSTSARDPVR